MPSQKQLEANRINARKSTGPRTAAGKAAVRFNALQSGIDAYSEVIPGEDQAKLQALVKQYQLRWNPQTPETQALVDICVHSDWLLRRMRHVEAGFWKTRLGHARMLVNCTEPEAHVFEYGGHIFERIQRRVNALQRNLQCALKDLARLQAAEREEEAAQSAAQSRHLRWFSIRAHRVRPQCDRHRRREIAEEDPNGKNIVIYPVACAVPDRAQGAPKLSGNGPGIRLAPGSFLAGHYGEKEIIKEEFFCNFEVNPEFEWTAMEAGFRIVARG